MAWNVSKADPMDSNKKDVFCKDLESNININAQLINITNEQIRTSTSGLQVLRDLGNTSRSLKEDLLVDIQLYELICD